jgi:transposase-like protein
MNKAKFQQIISQIPQFTHFQRIFFLLRLKNIDDYQKTCDIIESRIESNKTCPHCSSSHFNKHGFQSGLQRYRCKFCGKTFNSLTNTNLARLRKKDLWLEYSNCIIDTKSIRKSSKKLNISTSTAFRWRHRMLATSQSSEPQSLSGIIEADDTFFLESQKGQKKLNRPARKRGGTSKKRGLSKDQVSVLVACDRAGKEADYITGFGPTTGDWLTNNFSEHIEKDAILITDSAPSFHKFCSEKHIEHIRINTTKGHRVKGVFHIQNVNSYHSLIKNWIRRFRGVATKYLANYLGWCNELNKRKINEPSIILKIAIN